MPLPLQRRPHQNGSKVAELHWLIETLAAKILAIHETRYIFTVYKNILLTNILKQLSERGMTKNELSSLSGVSVSFVSDLTTGKGNPSLETMESIAKALETPLPTLLEATDLDKEALNALAGGTAMRSLPEGYVRVSGVLTEYQAFTMRQWDEANQKILANLKNKQSTPKKKP
jgi:transcriptional regulator with XRE-family HTH domain